MEYQAPVEDMLFLMSEVADLGRVAALPGYEDATPDTVAAVLEEAARFSREVLSPLNRVGDTQPARWRESEVSTPEGFKPAYKQFCEGGWQGLQHPQAFGGQGLPRLVAAACTEMWNSANLSFALCPLLTDGAIEALMTAGSDAQRQRYLSRLASGEWTGTMNLTEPQAGSDLAQVRTRVVPDGNGRYRVFGTKIFITYGEHDLADNIVHLVLARLPDAPSGVKGISLFLVPKFVVDEDGRAGERNDVSCVSIEHKMGIHGSPTAVLQFGDGEGAIGELIGGENRGLETMFIMMNAARFGVGLQGIAVAERAYQAARAYALERVQGRPFGPSGKRPIAGHPDVRRMLTTMRALTEGARALAYQLAGASDFAHASPEADQRAFYSDLQEYLVPIVKGWSTEMSVEVASLGVQIHGGMGFIEETGVAQYYRDARILPIYEGTTGIQANDLVGRKTLRDGGEVARYLMDEMDTTIETLVELGSRSSDAESGADSSTTADSPSLLSIATQLQVARDAYAAVVDFVVGNAEQDPAAVYAGSVPYLKLAGIVLSGWSLAKSVIATRARANESSADANARAFANRKLITARFFAEHILPQSMALRVAIVTAQSDQGYLALADDAV